MITIVNCYKLHTTIKLLCQHCRSRCCSASTGVAWIENYHLRVDIFEEENITSIGNFQHSRVSHKNESFDAVVMMVGIWSSQSPTGTMNEGSVTQYSPVDNWFCVMLIWYMHLCTGVLCSLLTGHTLHCHHWQWPTGPATVLTCLPVCLSTGRVSCLRYTTDTIQHPVKHMNARNNEILIETLALCTLILLK